MTLPETRTYPVTARDIRKFAQAIGEPAWGINVRPGDEGERLRAPLLFCQSFVYAEMDLADLLPDGSPLELNVDIPAARAVGGGSDFEIFGPVFEGDVLNVASRLREVYEKEGRSGSLYFVVVETVFTNQHDEIVAREAATYIKR